MALKLVENMRIIFLDIDGVLNNCTGAIMQPSGIKSECVQNLNIILRETGAKIVLISSWTDQDFPVEKIINFLYAQGVLNDSILPIQYTPTQQGNLYLPLSKEQKVQKFLSENKNVDNL